MKFTITYEVFEIPGNHINTKAQLIFQFTYEAELYQLPDLSHYINEYLQQFFSANNFQLLKIEEEVVEQKQ